MDVFFLNFRKLAKQKKKKKHQELERKEIR